MSEIIYFLLYGKLQVILMNEYVFESRSIDLAVSPHSLTRIFEFLRQNDFPFVVTNSDLQRYNHSLFTTYSMVQRFSFLFVVCPFCFVRHAAQLTRKLRGN